MARLSETADPDGYTKVLTSDNIPLSIARNGSISELVFYYP